MSLENPPTPRSGPPGRKPSFLRHLARYPVDHPGSAVLWVLIALLVYMQWPMVKGVAYRVSGAAAPADGIPWRSDFQAALAEARQSGKPLLVDFSATWCPPCQAMKHDVWPDAQVRKLASQSYVPVLADVDQNGELAARYGVDTIPRILVLDAQGKVVRSGDFMSAGEMVQFLQGNAGR